MAFQIALGSLAPFSTYVGIQTLNGARAIAIGNDIYFRSREVYNPDTPGGISEIGHEVTHASQAGRLSFTQYVREYAELRAQGLSDSDAYRNTTAEREAFKKAAIIRKDLQNLKDYFGGSDPCPPR